jgi:hypothetical protein
MKLDRARIAGKMYQSARAIVTFRSGDRRDLRGELARDWRGIAPAPANILRAQFCAIFSRTRRSCDDVDDVNRPISAGL